MPESLPAVCCNLYRYVKDIRHWTQDAGSKIQDGTEKSDLLILDSKSPERFRRPSAGVPPLPIPNREVKPCSADGTGVTPGRVGRRHIIQTLWPTPKGLLRLGGIGMLLQPAALLRCPAFAGLTFPRKSPEARSAVGTRGTTAIGHPAKPLSSPFSEWDKYPMSWLSENPV